MRNNRSLHRMVQCLSLPLLGQRRFRVKTKTCQGRWHQLCLLVLLTLGPLVSASAQAPVETGLISGTAELGGRKMPYIVYVPRNYSVDKLWPVILFLHGSGEVGKDGLR